MGRVGPAAAHDPVTDTIIAYGGGVGCSAAGCATVPWPELLDFGANDTLLSAPHAANAWDLLELDLETSAVRELAVDASWLPAGERVPPPEPEPGDPPDPTAFTVGVRGAAAATLGLHWESVEKHFVRLGAEVALWGGTYHQELVPFADHEAFDIGGVWLAGSRRTTWDGLRAGVSASGYRLHGDQVLRVVDADNAAFRNVPTGVDGRYDAAAVAIGPDFVATLGGRSSEGLDGWGSLAVYDTLPLAPSVLAYGANDWALRTYGARGIYDPIGDTAYFFGAFGSEGAAQPEVLALVPSDRPIQRSHAKMRVVHSELQVAVDSPSAADPRAQGWSFEVGTRFDVDCDGRDPDGRPVDCFTQRVSVHLMPWLDPGTAEAALVFGRSEVPLTRKEVAEHPEQPGSIVRFASPVALADGGTYELKITARADAMPVVAGLPQKAGGGWLTVGEGGSCGPSDWLSMYGYPARVVETPGDRPHNSAAPMGWVRVLVPTGFEPVVPGVYEPACAGLDYEVLDRSDPRFAPANTRCFDLSQTSVAVAHASTCGATRACTRRSWRRCRPTPPRPVESRWRPTWPSSSSTSVRARVGPPTTSSGTETPQCCSRAR